MPNRREARRTARAGSSHVRPAQVELVLCASSKRTEVQYIVLNYHLMLAGVPPLSALVDERTRQCLKPRSPEPLPLGATEKKNL
jgi:hypothetical protein